MSILDIVDIRHASDRFYNKPSDRGPFTAGGGALVCDGFSAFWSLSHAGGRRLPEDMARVLRPLMRRRHGSEGRTVRLLDLTAWLGRHLLVCDDCGDGGFQVCGLCPDPPLGCSVCNGAGEIACGCTRRYARIAGAPMLSWHVRRQLDAIEARPERVTLARLTMPAGVTGQADVLQISCGTWTYVRVGVAGSGVPDEMPEFPEVRHAG